MKLTNDHSAPADAVARQGIAPVICYPVEGLARPDLRPFRVARAGWRKVDEVLVPARAVLFGQDAGPAWHASVERGSYVVFVSVPAVDGADHG